MSGGPHRDPRAGTWWFVVDVGTGPDGKRRQARRRGFSTKKAAQEEMDRLRVAVTTRTFVAPAKATVGEYLAGWLDGLPTSGLRPSTIDGYRRNVAYVTPTLGAVRLDQLTAMHLDRLYSQLLATGRRQRLGGLSQRSVRYIHVVIHKALSDAVRKGILARNVAASADPPSNKSTRPKEMAWWKPAELKAFLDLTASEPLGPLFRLAALTGMRRGEVCGIRWSDVDLDAGRVEVRQQLLAIRGDRGTERGEIQLSERTKTDHGRRPIDLDPATVAALKGQRARQSAQRLAIGAGYRDHDLVFAQPDGTPLDPESVACTYNRRVARSGLPRIRFHDLRHTHVAHLIAAGEQPLLIAKRVGHASAAFTQDRYGHLFEEAGSQAASAVAKMVDGG
jgi:integrase